VSQLVELIELPLEQNEVLARFALYVDHVLLELLKRVDDFQKVTVPLVLVEKELIIPRRSSLHDCLWMNHKRILVEKRRQSFIRVSSNHAKNRQIRHQQIELTVGDSHQ
jgi:hypothetical protein